MTKRLGIAAVAGAWLATVTLEEMLTHRLLFALETATPVQRAFCRVAEGLPLEELGRDPDVLEALGGRLPTGRPREVAIIAGIRTFKSGLAACMGAQASQQCDVTGIRRGEVLKVSLVSTKLENARALYGHLAAAFTQSPALRQVLLSDPANSAHMFTVRHPSGLPVEIATVAGSRAGSSLVSVWQAACVFDEYSRMTGDSSDGVINWAEQRRAVVQRVRPGGYLAHITSPYGEFGPAYDHVAKHHGKPSRSLVVMRAKAWQMNPLYWTEERIAAAKEDDPDSYVTDVLAEFAAPEANLIPGMFLRRCIRDDADDIEPDPHAIYGATMDPATRSNGWTLAIWRRDTRKRQMVAGREWRGSAASPLDPEEIMRDGVAPLCQAYRIGRIETDGWGGDSLASIARRNGVVLVQRSMPTKERWERYFNVRNGLAQGLIELPNLPFLATDLLRLKKRINASGATIHLPLTHDGRHCDWAPAIMLGAGDEVIAQHESKTPDRSEAQRMLERAIAHYGKEEEDADGF